MKSHKVPKMIWPEKYSYRTATKDTLKYKEGIEMELMKHFLLKCCGEMHVCVVDVESSKLTFITHFWDEVTIGSLLDVSAFWLFDPCCHNAIICEIRLRIAQIFQKEWISTP